MFVFFYCLVVNNLTVRIQLSLTYTYGIDLLTDNTDFMCIHLSIMIETIAFIVKIILLKIFSRISNQL